MRLGERPRRKTEQRPRADATKALAACRKGMRCDTGLTHRWLVIYLISRSEQIINKPNNND